VSTKYCDPCLIARGGENLPSDGHVLFFCADALAFLAIEYNRIYISIERHHLSSIRSRASTPANLQALWLSTAWHSPRSCSANLLPDSTSQNGRCVIQLLLSPPDPEG
jgi:hypothetical protein